AQLTPRGAPLNKGGSGGISGDDHNGNVMNLQNRATEIRAPGKLGDKVEALSVVDLTANTGKDT
ncbi:MAG: hypothetical protein KGI32_08005, partial [Gammaproteobacteria bacterium]|nr:hypothetical protein [Gammaproteobacteria bacterium]